MNYFYLVVKMVRLWPMAGVPRSKGRYSRMLGRCSAPCALCSCLKCLAPCALRPCLNGLAPCALVLFLYYPYPGQKKRTKSRGPWSFLVMILGALLRSRLGMRTLDLLLACLHRNRSRLGTRLGPLCPRRLPRPLCSLL